MDGKQKECWRCQRILVEKSKLGLCPKCRAALKGRGIGTVTVVIPLIAACIIKAVTGKNKDKS